MNPATASALVVAGVFAVGNWIAVSRDDRPAIWQRVEYVCKPATLLALIVAAATLDPAAGADTRQRWFVVALVFSLLGDVLLMIPRDYFVGGLSAFFLAHCCYVAGFFPPGSGAGGVVDRGGGRRGRDRPARDADPRPRSGCGTEPWPGRWPPTWW